MALIPNEKQKMSGPRMPSLGTIITLCRCCTYLILHIRILSHY